MRCPGGWAAPRVEDAPLRCEPPRAAPLLLVAALLLLAACHKPAADSPEYRRTFSAFTRQHEGELRTCWAQEYAKRPTELKWETPTFRFTITTDGHVRDLSV